MRSGAPLLSTKDLTVGFRAGADRVLFAGLDLNLFESEIVCLMGPNGAGKSSLIRTLAGLQNPLQGEVILHSAEKLIIDRAKHIAVVLTTRVNAPHTTVRDLVTYGRYPYLDWSVRVSSDDNTIINEALATIGIQQIAERQISELSDGQVQMAMVARALAQDTPIILLDEPTAHLDLNNRVEMMKVLKNLSRQRSKAILVSTHELDLALQTADYVWLADNHGQIRKGIPEDLVLDGTFDDVFKLKGFDLKTGKMHHHPDKETVVALHGSGAEFMWTKNALERSGFRIVPNDSNDPGCVVTVIIEDSRPRWTLKNRNRLYNLRTIAELIELLGSNVCGIPE